MSRLRRVARDVACACAAASIALDRVGAPERARAAAGDGSSARAVVWRDARAARAGRLVEGDVVALARARESGGRARSVQVIARVSGGTCALRASERWRAEDGGRETDAGDVACGAIDGRVVAILWPPSRFGAVGREV